MEDICLEGVSFSYGESGKHKIFDGLTARFQRDKITVLTGPSGCGKSTLLYLAAGIYPQESGVLHAGTVTVGGQDPGAYTPDKRCLLAGMLFQNPDLQFCMDTVENELLFCLENLRFPLDAMPRAVEDALAFCGIPYLKKRRLSTLSGGEKQRAMLACLAAIGPKWLLLDEPFASLDDDSARTLAQGVAALHRERGIGVLAIDHRLDHWLPIADELRVMDHHGALLPEALHPATADPARLEELGITAPGRPYQAARPEKKPDRPPVLELRGLTLRQGDHAVLNGLDAAFRPGRITAILGESGSGKSTLFGAVSGLYRYGGEIFLEGANLRRTRKQQLGKIGFVTQNPQDQFVTGTVLDEVLVSLRNRRHPHPEDEAERVLRGIRLWKYRKLSPYMLSQGQQRRLGVAALLAYECRVLFCDEPTYAQDLRNIRAIMDALQDQVLERDICLVFSTHDRQLALDYADEILELREGKLYEITQSLV